MNMKHAKYILMFSVAGLLLSSCKKQLDLNDPDVISAANAFQNLDNVAAGMYGAYGKYGTYANDMYVNALLSDEAKLGVNNSGQGSFTYRYQFAADPTTGGDVNAAYFGYYGLIDQVNRVLPYVSTASPTATTPESKRDQIKAQLLALRGIALFDLLESYGGNYNPSGLGVPVMTVSDPNAMPRRNTMLEDMTQIESDLSTAKGLLPSVTATTFSDTLLNKVSIAAYQARIALYKSDYANAITYATEVINSNVKPLVTGATFSNIWTDASNAEVLFRILYTTSAAIGNLWTPGANIYVAPSDKLVADFTTDDIRRSAYIGGTAGAYYVNKFYTSSRGARVVDLKAIRTAEMYLIRAEAYAKQGSPNLTAGAADLNTLRAARIPTYTAQTFTDAASLVAAVLDERFKELCFEGFRFFDLRRNNLPVQRLASDASPAWQTLPANSFRFVLPIPQNETNSNPNIVQNPGY